MKTEEIRIGDGRIIAVTRGLDFPGRRMFIEILGPRRGAWGGAYLTKDDAKLLAKILVDMAEEIK